MAPDQMQALLLAADDNLAQVLAHLNVAACECGSCGHKRYEDWDQNQAAEALRGARSRIEKANRMIENGATCAQEGDTQ
jgi:hypothetical protein